MLGRHKKIREPAFYKSKTNIDTINYRVYYMAFWERILYFMVAAIIGAAIVYLFYGGVGKNEFGEPTEVTYKFNIISMLIGGCLAGYLFLGVRTKKIIDKRKNDLKLQFRELLESLTTSIASGMTIVDSLRVAQEDLEAIYPSDAYIIQELNVIRSGMNNNINIEELFEDLGKRSDIEDIHNFACVFEICYRKGGNMKDIIKSTHQIISEKMEVEQTIETVVAGSKNESNIMMVMPIGLIGVIKLMSPEFASNFVTPAGLIATTVAIAMFIAAYFIGRTILNIKI